MKIKGVLFAALGMFLVLATSSLSLAVDVGPIDAVLKKTVLGDQDFKVIDDFLNQAVQELVKTRNFTAIAQARTVILSRTSTQGQYAQRFSESAHRAIQSGFEQAKSLRPDERKTNVNISLLIVIDGLHDVRLADLAIPWLKDQNMVVRYWAVHALTNPSILTQLESGASSDPALAATIVARLKEVVGDSSPEILAQMAGFAGSVKAPQAGELLLQVADVRIKAYADWSVKQEFYEVGILKLLETRISSASAGSGPAASTAAAERAAVAQRFAQLYSYAIQRYIKGSEMGLLSDAQKRHLVAVLVETEEKCVGLLLGRPQLTIRRAIEKESMTALLDEHNKLLGGGATPGELPSKLGFDYGSNRTAPIPLPDPPKKP